MLSLILKIQLPADSCHCNFFFFFAVFIQNLQILKASTALVLRDTTCCENQLSKVPPKQCYTTHVHLQSSRWYFQCFLSSRIEELFPFKKCQSIAFYQHLTIKVFIFPIYRSNTVPLSNQNCFDKMSHCTNTTNFNTQY